MALSIYFPDSEHKRPNRHSDGPYYERLSNVIVIEFLRDKKFYPAVY